MDRWGNLAEGVSGGCLSVPPERRAVFKVGADCLPSEMGPAKCWHFLFQHVTMLIVKVFLASHQNFLCTCAFLLFLHVSLWLPIREQQVIARSSFCLLSRLNKRGYLRVLLQDFTPSQWPGCAFATEHLVVHLSLFFQPIQVPLNSSFALQCINPSFQFGIICERAAHMLHPVIQVSSKMLKHKKPQYWLLCWCQC